MKIILVEKNTLKKNHFEEIHSLEELINVHAKPGSVLEPNIDLAPILFSEDKQTAVKQIKVSVCSAVTNTEEYYHSMISEMRGRE